MMTVKNLNSPRNLYACDAPERHPLPNSENFTSTVSSSRTWVLLEVLFLTGASAAGVSRSQQPRGRSDLGQVLRHFLLAKTWTTTVGDCTPLGFGRCSGKVCNT
jgi:hypothetical protein